MDSKGCILLVDDEELVLDVGIQMLKRIGYRVLEARNSAEAIKIYKNNRFDIDLIILDYNLPDENGAETLRKIKDINPDAKVILSTGYIETPEISELLNQGCKSRLQKPYTIANLSTEIYGALG
jgi:CheY-like chemotaxis protein